MQKGGKKAVPRRCAVIRRTFPAADVVKTELRFVSYKRPGGEQNEKGFFEEVGQFLKDQMEDMENGKSETTGRSAVRSSAERTISAISASAVSTEALSSSHHEQNCVKREALTKAIPVLERLVNHYKQNSKATDDLQYRVLWMTTHGVLAETQQALLSGRANKDLLKKIRILTQIETNNSDSSP